MDWAFCCIKGRSELRMNHGGGCVSSADPPTAYCRKALTLTSGGWFNGAHAAYGNALGPMETVEVYTHDQIRFDAKGRTMSAEGRCVAGGRFVYYVKGYINLEWGNRTTKTPAVEFVRRPDGGRQSSWSDWQAGKSEWKWTVKTKLAPSTTADGILSAGWPKSRTLCGLVAIIIQEMLWHLFLSWKMWYYVDWLRKSRIDLNFKQSSNKSYASFSKLFSLKNEKCFTPDQKRCCSISDPRHPFRMQDHRDNPNREETIYFVIFCIRASIQFSKCQEAKNRSGLKTIDYWIDQIQQLIAQFVENCDENGGKNPWRLRQINDIQFLFVWR